MVEEAKLKFDAENVAGCAVDVRDRKCAFVDAVNQGLLEDIVLEIVELHVHAGFDGEAGGFCRRGNDVMAAVEMLYRAEVGEDEALKAPLLAEDFLEEKRGGGDGDAVDLMVGGHHALGVSLTEGRLE